MKKHSLTISLFYGGQFLAVLNLGRLGKISPFSRSVLWSNFTNLIEFGELAWTYWTHELFFFSPSQWVSLRMLLSVQFSIVCWILKISLRVWSTNLLCVSVKNRICTILFCQCVFGVQLLVTFWVLHIELLNVTFCSNSLWASLDRNWLAARCISLWFSSISIKLPQCWPCYFPLQMKPRSKWNIISSKNASFMQRDLVLFFII